MPAFTGMTGMCGWVHAGKYKAPATRHEVWQKPRPRRMIEQIS
jgi:hypothetical protein